MPIMVRHSGGGSGELCPAGLQRAVCCDVEDLGKVVETYQNKRSERWKVRLYWQSEHKRRDGTPFLLARKYTNSFHEKSALRHDLESWRGRPFTAAEIAKFDLEKLIGVTAYINVTHAPSHEGGTWANVTTVLPLPSGMSKMAVTPDYVRVADRPIEEQEETETSTSNEEPVIDAPDVDEIPF